MTRRRSATPSGYLGIDIEEQIVDARDLRDQAISRGLPSIYYAVVGLDQQRVELQALLRMGAHKIHHAIGCNSTRDLKKAIAGADEEKFRLLCRALRRLCGEVSEFRQFITTLLQRCEKSTDVTGATDRIRDAGEYQQAQTATFLPDNFDSTQMIGSFASPRIENWIKRGAGLPTRLSQLAQEQKACDDRGPKLQHTYDQVLILPNNFSRGLPRPHRAYPIHKRKQAERSRKYEGRNLIAFHERELNCIRSCDKGSLQ